MFKFCPKLMLLGSLDVWYGNNGTFFDAVDALGAAPSSEPYSEKQNDLNRNARVEK